MHTFFSSSCRKRTDTGSVSCCSLVIPISATCFIVFFVYPLFSYPLLLISPHPPRSSRMRICCLPLSTVTWYSLMNTGTRLEQTSFHCCHAPPPQVHCYGWLTMLSEGVEYSYPIFFRRRFDRPVRLLLCFILPFGFAPMLPNPPLLYV
ncbi:uncharacterized protein BO66DRAFT_219712 [Aspergillus aculeatinus CBS 121060]|uniref:Uncharacterized protein n=1 Tax=Aspergillus aculeatinus CBS 121060 TaxID=1448322 RepID=A0ACD1GUV7_9EURO|nr:hypothetical protein BO66DRAFT_219712 [Aspergillus aculeatinus CBS 121060]RAH65051.1 hypothetical protein BO66DRAFT_219712 [Aspergillus aculeatinus CBS 121060]